MFAFGLYLLVCVTISNMLILHATFGMSLLAAFVAYLLMIFLILPFILYNGPNAPQAKVACAPVAAAKVASAPVTAATVATASKTTAPFVPNMAPGYPGQAGNSNRSDISLISEPSRIAPYHQFAMNLHSMLY